MARNKDIFRVPESERKEYRQLVQRANRRIKASFKYIQNEREITDMKVLRAIYGDYAYGSTPYSRSIKFNSEKDYIAYKRHLEKWGGDIPKNVKNKARYQSEKKIKETRDGYYQAIINSLTILAIDTGNLDENGQLPADIADRVKRLSTEQLVHFFDDDPSERIEGARWGSDDYEGADMEQFVDVTLGHLKALRKIYPTKKKKKKK